MGIGAESGAVATGAGGRIATGTGAGSGRGAAICCGAGTACGTTGGCGWTVGAGAAGGRTGDRGAVPAPVCRRVQEPSRQPVRAQRVRCFPRPTSASLRDSSWTVRPLAGTPYARRRSGAAVPGTPPPKPAPRRSPAPRPAPCACLLAAAVGAGYAAAAGCAAGAGAYDRRRRLHGGQVRGWSRG